MRGTIQTWISDMDTKQQQAEQQKEEKENEKSELDVLFEPKRKW